MSEIETTQRTLARSQRSLELLELQAAGFGQLHIPVHVQIELEEKRAQIAQLRDRLAQIQSGAVVRELLPEHTTCPYPGMQPFKATDAQYFHGRDTEIRHLLQHLRHQRCIFVIGPSGSGKSSLIFAGLLPALQSAAAFPRAFWLVRVMRPGAQPLQALTDTLGGSSAAATQAVANVLAEQAGAQRLLLVIDQFEELFTLANRAERAGFVAALQALRKQPNCALIITMRADFYPDLMGTDLWPVEPSERLEVAPLRGAALRHAITRPAADVGVELEPALVERLIDDAHNEPGSLPLIQETMQLLWAEMDEGMLSLHTYERLGSGEQSGLAIAVATKADATLSELTPAQRQIARRIFLCLVQPGEGIPDTRRQRALEELRSAADDPRDFELSLEHLTAHRLLIRGGGDGGSAVDLSHEVLITGWPRLRAWLNEDRAGLLLHNRLTHDAREWRNQRNDPGFLYGGARLADAQRYAGQHPQNLSQDELVFLSTSTARQGVRERARYIGQAAGGALGTALGYGLAFALALLFKGANAGVVLLMFAAMFPSGELVGFCIGVALWLFRRRAPHRAIAAALAGGISGGLALALYSLFTSGTVAPLQALAGGLIGLMLGLGVGVADTAWCRLWTTIGFALAAIPIAWLIGGLPIAPLFIPIAGLLIGGLTGLGFYVSAIEERRPTIHLER